jgi:hypothetical protein
MHLTLGQRLEFFNRIHSVLQANRSQQAEDPGRVAKIEDLHDDLIAIVEEGAWNKRMNGSTGSVTLTNCLRSQPCPSSQRIANGSVGSTSRCMASIFRTRNAEAILFESLQN